MIKFVEVENKVKEAIFVMTGLRPIEEITENRYCLSIGIVRPLEVGFDKRRNVLDMEQMSFSAHLKMLEEISIMMRDIKPFNEWLQQQYLMTN